MKTNFDGVKVTLNGLKLVVPALNLKELRQYRSTIEKLPQFASSEPTDAELTELVELFHAAIVRNHPDVTTEQLEEKIDASNLKKLLPAVMGQSGFEVVEAGEELANL